MRQEVPTDEHILVTMTIVYRKANQMQALAEAYAAASAARPKDGSLLRGVFANHVRRVALPFCTPLFGHGEASTLLPLESALRVLCLELLLC